MVRFANIGKKFESLKNSNLWSKSQTEVPNFWSKNKFNSFFLSNLYSCQVFLQRSGKKKNFFRMKVLKFGNLVCKLLKTLLFGSPNIFQLIRKKNIIILNLCRDKCQEQRFERKIELNLFFDQKIGNPSLTSWPKIRIFHTFELFPYVGESYQVYILQDKNAVTPPCFAKFKLDICYWHYMRNIILQQIFPTVQHTLTLIYEWYSM